MVALCIFWLIGVSGIAASSSSSSNKRVEHKSDVSHSMLSGTKAAPGSSVATFSNDTTQTVLLVSAYKKEVLPVARTYSAHNAEMIGEQIAACNEQTGEETTFISMRLPAAQKGQFFHRLIKNEVKPDLFILQSIGIIFGGKRCVTLSTADLDKHGAFRVIPDGVAKVQVAPLDDEKVETPSALKME